MHLDRARAIAAAERKRLGADFLQSLRGCETADVDLLAARLGLTLPAAYREFLEWMGQHALVVFENARTQCDQVALMGEELQDLLHERGFDGIPDDAIVFYGYNGYHYRWIRASQGDDPPIYEYLSGEPIVRQTYDRFSAYIEFCIRDFAAGLEPIAT